MPDNEVKSERFDVPESPERNVYIINNFLGCDYTSSPSAVDENHSSSCINMIRYMPGKIRKRMGYESIASGSGAAYAIWKWDNDNYLVHIGQKIYHIGRDASEDFDFSVITSGVDTAYSKVIKDANNAVFEIPAKKYSYIRSSEEAMIFGNGDIFFYDGGDVLYTVNDYDMYIPKVVISQKPEGGGESYEAFNLLNPQFKVSFYVSSDDAAETVFHMPYDTLDSIDSIEVLNSSGEWETKEAGVDYTVNLTAGTVNFTVAPGQSPVEGEDNVMIVASKEFEGYYDRIANCRFAIAYGVNGNYDRIFISGNLNYPNFDWYSEKDDITYFPDNGYSTLGSDASPINGYAIISNNLVTFKGDGSDRQIAIVRVGTLDSYGMPIFTITNSLQGSPVIAPDTSVMAGIEPLFLTEQGIMAITANEVSGDQLMNSRSWYLNGKLLAEPHLENAFAIRNGDFYMLFINSHVYILDTLQSIATANAPYSTRQYATFYWENVPATCAMSIDGVVYFGTADGEIMKFYTDADALSSYNDNGDAIYCRYDTADIDALLFFKVKTYRYFALRVFPAVHSSVKIWALKRGIWELLKEDYETVMYFSFRQFKFSTLTFSNDSGLKIVSSKIRLKKMDHVRFRIENDQLNEPLMLDQFGVEYTQAGNYKN